MKYDYLNAKYWAVLSCRNAYFGEQGESNPGVCEWETCGKTSAFAAYIFLKSVSGNTMRVSSCDKCYTPSRAKGRKRVNRNLAIRYRGGFRWLSQRRKTVTEHMKFIQLANSRILHTASRKRKSAGNTCGHLMVDFCCTSDLLKKDVARLF